MATTTIKFDADGKQVFLTDADAEAVKILLAAVAAGKVYSPVAIKDGDKITSGIFKGGKVYTPVESLTKKVKAAGAGNMTKDVLALVAAAPAGISVDDIVAKTGATDKKQIYAIANKAKKDGKIAAAGKGLYKPV